MLFEQYVYRLLIYFQWRYSSTFVVEMNEFKTRSCSARLECVCIFFASQQGVSLSWRLPIKCDLDLALSYSHSTLSCKLIVEETRETVVGTGSHENTCEEARVVTAPSGYVRL